jgi:hypothetical protein
VAYKNYFEHLFECVLPPVPDNIEWRSHPTLPIEASNLGLIRPLDDNKIYRDLLERRIELTEVKRLKWIYESFNQVNLPLYCRVKPKNSNPYDQRPENIEVIYITDEMLEERTLSIKREKDFREQTVIQMLEREKKLSPDIDVYLYFLNLKIPEITIKHWKSRSPWYRKHYPIKKYN